MNEVLLTEMQNKFNEKKEQLPINLSDDPSLKWRGLYHNQYASNKRRSTRKSGKNEAGNGDREEVEEKEETPSVAKECAEEPSVSTRNATRNSSQSSNTSNSKQNTAKPSERVLRRNRTENPSSSSDQQPVAKKASTEKTSTSINITPRTVTSPARLKSNPIKVNKDNSSVKEEKESDVMEAAAGEKEPVDSKNIEPEVETKPPAVSEPTEEAPKAPKRITRRLNSLTSPKNDQEKGKRRPEEEPSAEKKKKTSDPDTPTTVLESKQTEEETVKLEKEAELKEEERKPRLLMKIRTEKDQMSIVQNLQDQQQEDTQPPPNTTSSTPENEPKKRGRRPGPKLNDKIKILPKRQGSKSDSVPVSPGENPGQRLSRRIKPTAKILANEELRHGFEIQNSARLNLSEIDSEKEGRSVDVKKISKKSFPEVTKVVIDEDRPQLLVTEQLNVDNIYTTPLNKPVPDPEQFLNEIKSSKVGVVSSGNPEEKRLNKKQLRRLNKMKEQHFQKLGLRKTSRSDKQSDSGEDSDENDEFVPPQKVNVEKTGVQLRHRNSAIANKPIRTVPILNPSEEQRQRINPSPNRNSLKQVIEGNAPRIICLCNQMSEFFSHKTSNSQSCGAVDQIGDKKIGCCNDIDDDQLNLQRPSARVSFMILCKNHKNRFYAHHCCPICGVFCTEGQFMLCKRNHLFHKSCVMRCLSKATMKGKDTQCPHCGIEVTGPEINLYMECRNELTFYPNQKTYLKSARISLSNGTTAERFQRNGLSDGLINLVPESVRILADRYQQRFAGVQTESEFTSRDFFYAVNNDDVDRVAEIISSGFDISAPFREFHNGTCLHLIAHFGSLNMLYLILIKAACASFINAMDKELRTAVMCAVVGKKHEILKVLIQCGADIAMKGPEGMTALHLAAKIGNFEATQILLEHYKQKVSYQKFEKLINAVDDGSWTALVWAAEHGHFNIESYLISLGANANICDTENNTVLHWAALSNRLETILPLLDSNCDFNLQNINGDSALHIACRNENTDMCLTFISHGADISMKNLADETPLDCVQDRNSLCARVMKFNLELKQIPGKPIKKVLCHDISNGRELFPIQITATDAHEAELLLPDFKYITKAIILQNAIQMDLRISQMRICACPDNCTSESCQCSEISSQNWYDPNGRLNSEFNFDDPAMIFECNDVCGCHKLLCKNRVVQNGSKVALQVFKCNHPIKGWGAKTVTDIPKGTFIAEYTGEILTNSEADRRTDDSYFFELGASEHCIDANLYGNVSRFFNHSCSPNVVPIRVYFDHQDLRFPKIAFFAANDIKADEEITFDYGEKFWLVKYKYFTCQCKQPNCRYSAQTINQTLEEYKSNNQRNCQ